jgi:hypothetical protein
VCFFSVCLSILAIDDAVVINVDDDDDDVVGCFNGFFLFLPFDRRPLIYIDMHQNQPLT